MGIIFLVLCLSVNFYFLFSIESIGQQDKPQKYTQATFKIQKSLKLRQRGVKKTEKKAKIEETQTPKQSRGETRGAKKFVGYKENTKYCKIKQKQS